MRRLFFRIKYALSDEGFLGRILSNKKIRVRLSLIFGLIVSAAYLIFNLVSGIAYRSPSFITVAVYYLLLASVRYVILKSSKSRKTDRDRRLACRRGGILLLLTDILITLMIFYSVNVEVERRYGTLVFTVFGVHTVYSVVSGILGVIGGGGEDVPTHRAAYAVKIAATSMSLFNLLSAIITSFVYPYELAEILRNILGAAVSLGVLLLSCSMIFSFPNKADKIGDSK